jgi:hypothetical protein
MKTFALVVLALIALVSGKLPGSAGVKDVKQLYGFITVNETYVRLQMNRVNWKRAQILEAFFFLFFLHEVTSCCFLS